MSIGFNFIAGTIVAPIFTFEVNSAGNFENNSRLLLIGHKTSAGEATLDEPVICTSLREAGRLAGAGSMLHEMYRVARMNSPAQEIWILPATETGTAEIKTVTVDSVPSAGGVGLLDIAGQRMAVTIPAGSTAAQVADLLNTAINAYYQADSGAYLPYTSTVNAAVVSLTSRHKGDIWPTNPITIPAIADNAFTGNLTVATPTAGAGSPDLSAGIAALGDDEFDWIVSPFDDATNLGRYTALLSDVSGRWAWNQQIYGHVFFPKTDTISNLTTFGLSKDDRHLTAVPRPSGDVPSMPWAWVSAIVARIVPWLGDGALGNVSRNQTGLTVEGLAAPDSRADWYDFATRDSLLRSGISTVKIDRVGRVQIDKIITMQRTTNGQPDSTFRSIQTIGQLIYSLRYLRERLSAEHSQKAIANDNPRNLSSITTLTEIKGTLIAAYRELELRGVTVDARKAAEMIQVERDPANANRVNVGLAIDFADPLDILATNARIYAQFPSAA